MISKRFIDPTPKREIARGSERQVYSVKNAPNVLLKVMKSKHLNQIADADDRTLRGWLTIRRAYAVFRREQRAWTNAMLHAAKRQALPPIAGIGDFVLTPNGLGQIVERITTPDGETAPTLHDLAVEMPISDVHLGALNAFVSELYDWHVPAYDLGPKNIVWDEENTRFLLVDGFGDRAFIPIVTWIKAANDWQLDRSFEKTAARSPLLWDRRTRRFARAP